MKVLILGIDGYIGYPLALHLIRKDHIVYGVDNYIRRTRVARLGSDSLTPISSARARAIYLSEMFCDKFPLPVANIGLGINPFSSPQIESVLRIVKPDAIVHLAEQPSAAWSMMNAETASITQTENVIGTLQLLWAMRKECPQAHLVKLGTMGEYGTPNCDIPEGTIPKECLDGREPCPMSGLLFPRTAGSFYHLTKVHDTHNIHFACRNWGLRSTDIMQGVVFGLAGPHSIDECTRFDYDECFGTVINRFCVQAIIGHPLTVYGEGGQTRGYLPLQDSLQCLTIALEHPPKEGEYRTLNQFESTYTINDLAISVQEGAAYLGLNVPIEHISNPRLEAEQHYYNPYHQKLFALGYQPTENIQAEITTLIKQLLPYKDRVKEEVILPKTLWR